MTVNTAWRKVLRDFWQERTRTVLVVLAIALGIAGFTTVLASYAIITRALNEGYLASNPASATLHTDNVDDALLAAVAAHPGIAAAEARRFVTGRIKAGPGSWKNLMLIVVKDFSNIRVSTLQPEGGAWPPAAGEMLIERDAFQVARTRIGETVLVRTGQGAERSLRVSGGVHDVGLAQARMENQVYGYITLETLVQLGAVPKLDQLKILVAENRYDAEHVRRIAEETKKLVESLGRPVGRVEVPAPGKHPHADLMGRLLLTMAAFGLFVLLLSGVLVINLLSALMAAQIRQIGVMKAIGGSRAQIARIYFSQALLLGGAALVLAVPLGLWGSRLLCRQQSVFLNFDIPNHAVPAWVFLLVAVVGLLVPLLAAAVPVWKSSGVPVREALADDGVGTQAIAATAFDRLMAGWSGAARPLLLALRNSFRRRTRLVMTLITLALGGLFFISALNVRSSMIAALDHLFAGKQFDLSVALGTMVPLANVERALGKTPAVVRGEGWIATQATLPAAASGADRAAPPQSVRLDKDRFPLIALPEGSKSQRFDIVAGRALKSGETDAVVVNNALAAAHPEMKVGNTIKFLTPQTGPTPVAWRVAGITREPFSGPVGYISKAYFERLPDYAGMTNTLRLSLRDISPAAVESTRTLLDQNLEQEGVRAIGAFTQAESRFGFDEHMVMIYVFLIVMSCIIGGVGGLGLMTTMSLNVLERRREMGVLRAIGASATAVRMIVVAEGALIGLMSWALAVLASWPVGIWIGNALGTRFNSGLALSYDPRGLIIWLIVSLAVGILASFLPAWQASRRPVREALA